MNAARATIALLLVAAAGAPAASAQSSWWRWGTAGNPTVAWDPERVADYMLTGQPPHPAVARIVAPEDGGTSLGSGVLVDVNRSQGLVLTNWHVVRDSRSALLVQFPDGFQSAGTVVRWDEAWDLAAVVIWRPAVTPVPLAVEPPALGEVLTIAGYGRGAYREQTGPCTEYLSPGRGYAQEFVEMQATARQGDSGGPMFNGRRELAGVLFGQAEGRTIGSVCTRVRAFLAEVGSQGFTPTPLAEFSVARAVDRSVGTAATADARLADGASDPPLRRSMHVAGMPVAGLPAATMPGVGWPGTAGIVAVAAAPPAATGPPSGSATSLAGLAAVGEASRGDSSAGASADIAELLNPLHNGSALLATAGGLALFVLGLRTIFGGRAPSGQRHS
jgi:S1-C subfamily serine protease